MLMDLPDELLLEILAKLQRAHVAAATCKRLRSLARSSVTQCDVLCAWRSHEAGRLPALLKSLPQLSRLRLQETPNWITCDHHDRTGAPAALQDLVAARQETRTRPGTPLWLAFCDSSFETLSRYGAHGSVFSRNCNDTRALRRAAAAARGNVSHVTIAPTDDLEVMFNTRLRGMLESESRQLSARTLHALVTFTGLRELELAGHIVDDERARALAGLQQLQSLSVGYHRLSAAGARALGTLTGLQRLDVGPSHPIKRSQACGRNTVAWFEPSASPHVVVATLPQLQHLTLYNAVHTSGQLQTLGNLKALHTLRLFRSTLTDTGDAALSRLTRLSHLELTSENGTPSITSAGVAAIGMLLNLRYLNLSWYILDDAAASQALRQLTRCETLILLRTGLGSERLVRHQPPHCAAPPQLYAVGTEGRERRAAGSSHGPTVP